jgi:hypothetical protein
MLVVAATVAAARFVLPYVDIGIPAGASMTAVASR